jgi:hypothetical protein
MIFKIKFLQQVLDKKPFSKLSHVAHIKWLS